MDIRDQAQTAEVKRLTEQLAKQQQQTTPTKQDQVPKDPYWEQPLQSNDHWQQDLQRTGRMPTPDRQPQAIVGTTTPVFAMADIVEITKVIEECVDDYVVHGGTIADRNAVNSQIVVDWVVRVRMRLEERSIPIKDKSIFIITNNRNCQIISGKDKNSGDGYKIRISVARVLYTPSQEFSPERDAAGVHNLRRQSPHDDDDGGDLGDEDNDEANGDRHPEEHQNQQHRHRVGGDGDRQKEFSLVNLRNIIITIFTGKCLHSNPYLAFNNQLRRLILIMGVDGEDLLDLVDLGKNGVSTS